MNRSLAPAADIPDEQRLLSIVQQLVAETHPDHSYPVSLHALLDRDLALDSLARVELMLRVGKAFSVEMPGEVLAQANTPQDILRYLRRAAPGVITKPAAVLERAHALGLPEGAQTLVEVLEWHAANQPERLHILLHEDRHGELPIRYRDLLDDARTIASGLIKHGLQPRQTVALMLPTGREYLACFFGTMLAGGIPLPIYPPARAAQIEDHLKRHTGILANAEAVFIITILPAKPVALMLQAAVPSLRAILTPSELAAVPTLPHFRPQAGDIAFLQYTSGSTGDPKGVMLTHANLLANIRALGKASDVTAEDVFVSWLPLYHDMGLIGAWFGSLYHGIPLVLMSPLAFLAQPSLWLQTLSRHHGTISAAPNFAYELCLRHIDDSALTDLDLSDWRLALNGAEPVNPATLEAFAARFAGCGFRRQALTPVYGLAECSVGLTFPPVGRGPRIDQVRRAPFSGEGKALPAAASDTNAIAIPGCGRPLPNHEIRIVDETGNELPERCIGRLEFHGPSASAGYYRNPEATAKLSRQGWLDSGDYAYMADGEVFVTGRIKDLIKRGGRNLYPYDLEQAVGKLAGIRRGCVAVFSTRHDAGAGERLVVMAETSERDDSARAKLRREINQTAVDVIGSPPDDIALVPPHTVLKTSSGKIRRIASREIYERGDVEKYAVAPGLQRSRFLVRMLLASARVRSRQAGAWIYGAYAWGVFAMLVLCCGGLAMLLREPSRGRRVARFGARLLFRLTGVPLSAKGLEHLPSTPHVLLVNHTSFLDAIVLTALLPARPGYAFTAKQEFASQRFLYSLMRSLGTLFIERFDVQRSTSNVGVMTDALRSGQSLVVFPEGTFSRDPGLKPFHSGAFLAAQHADAPIAVAGLNGTRTALRSGTWLPRRRPIALEVGPVLIPRGTDWNTTMQLSTAARKAMVPLSGEFDPSA